jgi:hypothetical protein
MDPPIARPSKFRAWWHLPELALDPVTLTGSALREGGEAPLRGSTVTRQAPREDPRARRAMLENESSAMYGLCPSTATLAIHKEGDLSAGEGLAGLGDEQVRRVIGAQDDRSQG